MLVAHLSDPHLGSEEPQVAAALLDDLGSPAVVVGQRRPHAARPAGAVPCRAVVPRVPAVVCTGHLHAAFASDAGGFRDETRSMIAVHAGTCISTRTRGEPNGYNRLILDGDRFTIEHRVWDGTCFAAGSSKRYHREGGAWATPVRRSARAEARA